MKINETVCQSKGLAKANIYWNLPVKRWLNKLADLLENGLLAGFGPKHAVKLKLVPSKQKIRTFITL